MARALEGVPDGVRCLLPDACLNEGRFLDGLTLADLPRPVEVVPTEGASLRRALDGTSFRPACAIMSPMVVVAGRPNVGKSSLVNRIVGRAGRRGGGGAGGDPRPQGALGRVVRRARSPSWTPAAGWPAGDALEAKVSEQAERALAEADVILMVVDVTTGVTEEDLAAAKVIRRAGPPVRLVVNKVEAPTGRRPPGSSSPSGWATPIPVSSLHGRGTGDLLDEVVGVAAGAHSPTRRTALDETAAEGQRPG